jgi:hypothetical protein
MYTIAMKYIAASADAIDYFVDFLAPRVFFFACDNTRWMLIFGLLLALLDLVSACFGTAGFRFCFLAGGAAAAASAESSRVSRLS